jgi:hypothetical protein
MVFSLGWAAGAETHPEATVRSMATARTEQTIRFMTDLLVLFEIRDTLLTGRVLG